MATLAPPIAPSELRHDHLSGTPRAHAIDRWIYVFMAAWFIAIVLAGFIPSSLTKIAAVQSGERPPFPFVMHMHAVLMGAFLLLLLAQTWLMATGRKALHMQLGMLSLVLVPAIVIVGLILAPTMYHEVLGRVESAPPEMRDKLQQALSFSENIKLIQIRIGILFPLFIAIALRARGRDAGLHKRMMILATVIPLPAGIDRIPWLPKTLPESPLSPDLYTLLAIAPMFIWDVVRNRYVHRAYWIWLGIALPFTIAVHALWDTAWWHATARQLMGV
ncbi:MAG TPA: hypothetical protein VEB39_08875 [Sphingomicrobium sp.]|nr:hypothetical protein [Sphingomicrobium sp.]